MFPELTACWKPQGHAAAGDFNHFVMVCALNACMDILKSFMSGAVSVLQITSAPLLYRYPYRNSGEGLRSDWQRIAADVESVMGKLKAEADDGRR